MITQTILKEIFFYDPNIGHFIRKRKQKGIKQGSISGGLTKYGYLTAYFNKKHYSCHRLAWVYIYGTWPNGQIDHINGIKTDNRIVNLRDVHKDINNQNQRNARITNKSTNTLGTFKNGNSFAARICANNKKVYLGTFKTLDEASNAYIVAKRLLHIGCTI